MERCDQYADKQLLDYLLDRTGEDEYIAIQFHLAECAVCRERMRRMRRLCSFLEEDTGRSFSLHVTKRTGQSLWSWKKSWKVIAAVCCLLIMIGVGFYYRFEKDRQILPGIRKEVPVDIRESPIYHSIDTVRSHPDSLRIPKNKKKKNKESTCHKISDSVKEE